MLSWNWGIYSIMHWIENSLLHLFQDIQKSDVIVQNKDNDRDRDNNKGGDDRDDGDGEVGRKSTNNIIHSSVSGHGHFSNQLSTMCKDDLPESYYDASDDSDQAPAHRINNKTDNTISSYWDSSGLHSSYSESWYLDSYDSNSWKFNLIWFSSSWSWSFLIEVNSLGMNMYESLTS